jgi:hypothetical protein
VCPEHIKITDNALIPMKERVGGRKYDPLVWLGDKIGRRTHKDTPKVPTRPAPTGRAAPGVAGRAFDADLHRPGRAEAVLAAVHARQRGLAVVALHRPDAGQDRPRHAVLLPDLLYQNR